MGAERPVLRAALLCALLALAAAAPTEDPTASACPRGCRCFAAGADEDGASAANCSSPAAALALGARLRVLRLSRYDDHLSVKEGAFRALSGLRELHLDHLGLVKVYPGAFRGLSQLETLDLSHNALSAGDELSRALRDLPALRRLSLRGNNFGAAHGVAPALASRTLKFVDLGRCKLRDLPPTVFAGLTHVRHLVLDGNFIREFVAASYPRSVVSIDLSHNDIDRITRAELNKLENVDSIELAENPIHCTCELLKVSFEYNMNKAVVCAYPKQLMGKDLLKIKKHQVCGGHKKFKREAGNELDDEALSAEEVDNEEDLVDSPVEEADPEEIEVAANAADNEKTEEEETPEETPEKLESEAELKGPAVEDAGDEDAPSDDVDDTAPESPAEATSAEEKPVVAENDEEESEPEDLDGVGEDGKSHKETKTAAWDDDAEEQEKEVVDHAAPHTKSETPPDEVDTEEDEPEEAPADDDNEGESKAAGAAIRVDDGSEGDEPENAEETSNVENVVATDNDENTDNEDEIPVEGGDDPPDSLPASTYNHIQAEGENASHEKKTDVETEAESNEDSAPEEAPADPEMEDHSAPQVDDPPNDSEDNKYEETETGDGVLSNVPIAEEETSNEDNPLKEDPEQVENAEAEHSIAEPDTITDGDDDVEEADTNNSGGVPIVGEGARMETAPKTDADDADGDAEDGDEAETKNEDEEDALNTVNNDDNLPSVVHSKVTENEPAEGNSEEADNVEDGADDEIPDYAPDSDADAINPSSVAVEDGGSMRADDVENVPDNANVVHSSGVGARVEDAEANSEVDDADADEDTDDNVDDDDGGVGVLTDHTNIEETENKHTENNAVHDRKLENTEDETEGEDNVGVDAVENEAEEHADGEDDGAKESDVLVGAGLDNEDEEKEEDEEESEEGNDNVETRLVDSLGGGTDAEAKKVLEEELEEEMEEDKAHATLGHEDLDAEETSGEKHTDNTAENENEAQDEDEEEPIVIPPLSGDNTNEDEDALDTEDDGLGTENDELNENKNIHTGHSHDGGTDTADENARNEYEDVVDGRKEGGDSPGGALSFAPVDNEESEEEGSGNADDVLEETPVKTHTHGDDWADDTEGTDNEKENEAVPPLGNADSKEVDASGERVDENLLIDAAPSEEPPLHILGGADNATGENAGSGAGAFAAGVPLDRGDEEPASNEEDEGSGQAVPFGHVPAITENDTDKTEDEDEGSGKGLFIPVLPGQDKTTDGDEPEVEDGDGDDDMDDIDKATTVAPVVAPEDEFIARAHVPSVFAAPPQAAAPPKETSHEVQPPVDEEEEPEGGEFPPEGAQGRDRSDAGRALVPPGSDQANAYDENDPEGGTPDETASAGEDGDLNVDVIPGMDDAKKGNIAEAGSDGDHADGSEALNKDDALSMNTIASYVVLGAIMVIVVFLLGYAVCRSRRQKSPSARDKDPENPDRELQEVNKPLINNHHSSAPEKQPLDETQQPLMTKEASLTTDPEKKKPLAEDTTDAANHKPKQNGTVSEVGVEKQTAPPVVAAPLANGKASSPAAERAPSPAAPAPAPSPTAAPPPPTTPTGPAAPAASPTANGHGHPANGNALPLANGGGSVSPGGVGGAAPPPPASSPAAPPVSPGAVRVVAKELPDSVAKRPVIIMNRGADPQQQV